jgi:hypothetical protein
MVSFGPHFLHMQRMFDLIKDMKMEYPCVWIQNQKAVNDVVYLDFQFRTWFRTHWVFIKVKKPADMTKEDSLIVWNWPKKSPREYIQLCQDLGCIVVIDMLTDHDFSAPNSSLGSTVVYATGTKSLDLPIDTIDPSYSNI